MISFLTMLCLVSMVIPAAIGNIIAYPISKKWSLSISDYIKNVLALRLFAILRAYRSFYFWGYEESKKDLPEQFIVISNHQSLLDIPVFFKFFHGKEVRFIAKDTLGRHIPLVSEMLRTQQHCLIPRKAKPMDAMRYVETFGKRVIKNNQIPVLFPEGSRTKNGQVGKFYSAGFRKLVESTNLPIVVCALEGGYALRDLRKIFTSLKKGSYRVKVLKVYDCPKTKDDCNVILDESRQLIQEQVDSWRKIPSNQKY